MALFTSETLAKIYFVKDVATITIPPMNIILHITTQAAWETAVSHQTYRADSLDSEGFIHCSTPAQLLIPANAIYRGRQDLILLCIEPGKLTNKLVYEDCYESGIQFPHVYGDINPDAVLKTVPFPPNDDGSFSLPDSLDNKVMHNPIPLLEYDATPTAVIEPSNVLPKIDIAEHCVLCFFQDVIQGLLDAGKLREVYKLGSEIGRNLVYEMDVNGQRLTIMHPGVGAPLAAAFVEELIALGCNKFIACGGCGVLNSQVGFANVVIADTAVRDEGTSYHYLPPSREVTASETAVAAIQQTLEKHHVDYVIGKTWTTDAVYRETPAKVAQRRAEGCLVVEMEAAAFFAVAQFRKVTFGQLVYGGDDLTGDDWNSRNWQQENATREKLFWLAAEACLKL